MRIIEEYSKEDRSVLNISEAKYIGDFAIRVYFNNGRENLIDFKPFLTKANHPSIKKYLQEEVFINFNIVDGNLTWNDYDLIFPIGDLYEGKIKS